jgi:hypothetical protein
LKYHYLATSDRINNITHRKKIVQAGKANFDKVPKFYRKLLVLDAFVIIVIDKTLYFKMSLLIRLGC